MADYPAHRPQGCEGQGDPYLLKIVRRLRRAIAEAQDDFAYDTLRLPSKLLGELAGILVDFAEDIHADIGIWAAYEHYNVGLLEQPCRSPRRQTAATPGCVPTDSATSSGPRTRRSSAT